ncbi:MAG: type 1 fimbrial protein [Pseudomonadota bacterium]
MIGLTSDGTITFTGAVTESSCKIKINGAGSGDGSVTLPVVDITALGQSAAKNSAGGTFFSISLSACAGSQAQIAIYFEAGPNVDAVTGGLMNTAAGSNVEVNIYNASDATLIGTQVKPGTNTSQPEAQTMADAGTQWFYAGYSTAANGGLATTPGAVSTSITYSLVYQ